MLDHLKRVFNMTQYDNIAEQYDQSAEQRSDREVILVPSARHYLGDLHGKRVLDLACGSGYFTRLIKGWGADHVVGADISAEMIELAEQRERLNPQAIEYYVGDAANPRSFGEFDVVFAGFLLHYSSSIEQLEMMCRTISLNLAQGGRFVSFNENPAFPVHDGIKYGVSVRAIGDLRDGTKMERTHYADGKKDFSFEHYHYAALTYERALNSAGLSQIEWKQFVSSGELSREDREYWRDYLENFSITVLLCRKE